ncbi:MAG TPA: glycosyltransferase family 4 protein [Methylomirabilota bacterium]|jgi:UDP-glucose:(heptosyl)LPS alpha-1,3-glucosyltransferase|nr:glycosyltransferase family 4 protein [Methylomirabilota bacterium]
MRLAIICRAFSFHGGVETATAGLMSELIRRGHDLDLLSTKGQQDLPGVRVRRLPTVRQPSLLRLLSFALAARRAVSRASYDIVQSHERTLQQDIYRAGEGVHRAYHEAMGRRSPRVNPYHRAMYSLEDGIFSLRSARQIVAISRRGKAEVERMYGTPAERVSLVYNGVDLDRFHPENRARLGPSAREALGLPRDRWVVLFVGSGFERKGLGPLLEAVSRLPDGQCQLVVAGKGDVRPYQQLALRLGIAPRVHWLGPRRDTESLYAACDVVALPALYEPFGNVHLEALASGVPVLTSVRAGGAEVITSGANGWVVPEPVGPAIAEGLQALRESDRVALAASARASAEPFTYAAQADSFEGLYRALRR